MTQPFTGGPEFPVGTPEYDTYANNLKIELRKWAAGEHPYEYDEENGCGSCGRANPPTGCAINCGARMDDVCYGGERGE